MIGDKQHFLIILLMLFINLNSMIEPGEDLPIAKKLETIKTPLTMLRQKLPELQAKITSLKTQLEKPKETIAGKTVDITASYKKTPEELAAQYEAELAQIATKLDELKSSTPEIFQLNPTVEISQKTEEERKKILASYKELALFDIVKTIVEITGSAHEQAQAGSSTYSWATGSLATTLVGWVAELKGFLSKETITKQIKNLEKTINNLGLPVFFDKNLLADIVSRIPSEKLSNKDNIAEILRDSNKLTDALSAIILGEKLANADQKAFDQHPGIFSFVVKALELAPNEILPAFVFSYLGSKLTVEELRQCVSPNCDKIRDELRDSLTAQPSSEAPIRIGVGTGISNEEENFIKTRQEQTIIPCLNGFVDKCSVGGKLLDEEEKAALKEQISKKLNIGLACSGGGCRAQIATIGFVQALKELELFDALAYMTTLSGSTWMLFPYVAHDFETQDYNEFVKFIKNSLQNFSRPIDQDDLNTFAGAVEFHRTIKDARLSIVDMYGFLLYRAFLKPQPWSNLKLSALQTQLNTYKYPLPIATAVGRTYLETKAEKESKRKFWWHEFSPFDVGCHYLNTWIKPEYAWSNFDNGKTDLKIEPPLWYLMGTWGSAFALDQQRLFLEIEKKMEGIKGFPGTLTKLLYSFYQPTLSALLDPKTGALGKALFGGSDFIGQMQIDQTQSKDKIPLMPGFYGNPLRNLTGEYREQIEKFVSESRKEIKTFEIEGSPDEKSEPVLTEIKPFEDNPLLELTDAGHFFNLPVPPLLRRNVNLILICDASGYGKPERSDLPKIISYAQSYNHNFPLKKGDIQGLELGKITKAKPVIMFSDDPNDPVVAYCFSQPKSPTLKFHYTEEEFDAVYKGEGDNRGVYTLLNENADAIKLAYLLAVVYKGLREKKDDKTLKDLADKIKFALKDYRLTPAGVATGTTEVPNLIASYYGQQPQAALPEKQAGIPPQAEPASIKSEDDDWVNVEGDWMVM